MTQNTQQLSPPQDPTHPADPLPSVHRLKTISVIGGFLDGVQLDLADGLNCIIGARGTGKTTTLELVRYAIDALPSREANPAEYKRIESLIQQNLSGGRVEVDVETKDGLQYIISRSRGEEPIVLTADGSPTAISLAGSGIFKADIFSQNEVERIADRATSQLVLIDNFEAEAIAQIDTELRQVQAMLAANASRIMPLQDKLASLADELNTLPSVKEKLKKFSTAEGEDSAEIDRAHALKALRDRERHASDGAGEMLQTIGRELASQIGQIDRQASALIGTDITDGPNGSMLQDIVRELSECGQEVDRLLEQAQSRIAGAQEELARRATVVATIHKQQELEFRAVIEQHKQAQGQAAERAQLERLRNDLLAKKRLHRETTEQLRSAHSDRDELLARLSELRDERFAIRQAVVRRINQALAPAIRVSIIQHGNAEHYQRLLEKGLRGARIKHGMVAQKIVSALWPAELSEAVRQEDTAVLVDKAELSASQAEKVVAALEGSELLFHLETVELLDRPRIELKDGDAYKDSLELSTGQKCTSILPILLLDSENPLLVDQPEDNLDNGFIYGTIVDSIRKIKARRQLVFVTHNPNVPVLGDAEGVFVLASDGASGRLVGAGSVDDCKSHIVTLLEDPNAFVRRSAQRALARRRRDAEATDRKRRYLDEIETEYARIERLHGGVAARRARRMAERLYDVLVGAMVHDLQNIAAPLDAAVKALCGKSSAGDVDPQDLRRRLGRMARQTSDLLRILDDLHVYASHSSKPGRPETLEDLIVQSHSAALAALKIGGRGLENVRVRFEVDKRASLVCNRNQMVRALANIIKDAYEAHSPAPREFRSGEVRVVGRRLGADHVQFVVADNGMGIPPDELRAVLRFVPGNTSKKATGTGFGLPIARRMIQRHGGSLAIDSNEGVGTLVTITIPIKREAGGHPCTTH